MPCEFPEPDIPAVVLLSGLTTIVALTAGWWIACSWLGLPMLPATATLAAHWIPLIGGPIASAIHSGELINIPVSAVYIAIIFGTVGFMVSYTGLYHLLTPPSEIHIRGRRLLSGSAALRQLRRESRDAIQRSGEGLQIAPGIHLDLDRETRHFLILGSPSSGKTTVIRPLIEKARARGDKCIVFDNKSDFTKSYDNPNDVILIAGWDSRGWAWHIAQDIRTLGDARELVAVPIQKDHGAIWPLAARQVLTALIHRCQQEKPGEWSFADIVSPLSSDSDAIINIVDKYLPEASILIRDMKLRTTQSIMITLVAFLEPDRKSTRLNSSHTDISRMPSSA